MCLPWLWAQTSGNYLTVGQMPRISGKPNAAVEARIACTVQPGYHVNSNTPAEEYLIPLKLTWAPAGSIEAGAVTYPKPELEKYPFAEKPLSVFTGRFEVIAHFKIAATATAGPGMIAGKLRYQACNDRACFQPKTVDIAIPYRIQ